MQTLSGTLGFSHAPLLNYSLIFTVEQLSIEVEDQKGENKTLKRKHAANVKDLTRQLHQAKKRLDNSEAKDGGRDSTSMGSRTSSSNSLDTINNHQGGGATTKPPSEPPTPVSSIHLHTVSGSYFILNGSSSYTHR